MKKILFFLFFSNVLLAQSISKQVISIAGTSFANAYSKLSWVSGETVVGLMHSPNSQLGNGYIPSLSLQNLSIENNLLGIEVMVLPNPTSQYLSISSNTPSLFEVKMMDVNGKMVFVDNCQSAQLIDVSQFPIGIYIVSVENSETHSKNTYKVIKK